MIRKIHFILPHILFAILAVLIILPSLESVGEYYSFLTVVILIEVALIFNRKSIVANDIGIIVFVFLIFWEYTTAKHGVKNGMLYPAPENVFAIFIKDYKKMAFKGGFVEGNVYDKAQIEEFASIPGRDVLIARFMGSIQSPMTKLALTLKAIAEKEA